jgi:hypothetical protein
LKLFNDAREFAQSLNLQSAHQWKIYHKSHEDVNDVPYSPQYVYKNKGWVNWGDFLGTNTPQPQKKQFRSFKDAREFVHSLNLKNKDHWILFCKQGKKPHNFPSNPDRSYKNKGWVNWGDFLGTGNMKSQKKQFRSFENAREFAQSLKLKNSQQWRAFSKSSNRPEDVPSTPYEYYKNKGWVNWGNFLGTGNIQSQKKQFRSFENAREFAQSLKLKNRLAWLDICKSGNKPQDIPSNPNKIYPDLWVNWGDFLGTDNVSTAKIHLTKIFRK